MLSIRQSEVEVTLSYVARVKLAHRFSDLKQRVENSFALRDLIFIIVLCLCLQIVREGV